MTFNREFFNNLNFNLFRSNFLLKDFFLSITIAIISGIGIATAILFMIGENVEKSQIMTGKEILAYFGDVEREASEVINNLNLLPYTQCSPENLLEMRKTQFKSNFVKDIGFLENGTLLCTTGAGILAKPLTNIQPPDYIKPNKISVWPNIDLFLFDKKYAASIFQRDRYNIVYDNNKAKSNLFDNYLWKIDHVIDGKQYFWAGTQNVNPTKPIDSLWALVKYFVPITTLCDKKTSQCVSLKVQSSQWVARYTFTQELIFIVAITVAIFVFLLMLKLLKWQKSIKRRVSLAVRNGTFHCVYQPIVSLDNQEMVGVEVLARIFDNHGNITPDKFIPIVSQLNKTWDFTEQMIKLALKELVQVDGFDGKYKVTLNIFPDDIASGEVLKIIDIPEVKAFQGQLVIEVTEGEALEGDKVQINLAKLHDAGFEIAIDDFGTGYSNLGQLKKVSCQILKIDRTFMAEVDDDTIRVPLIAHMVNIARSSDLKLVAEGVETAGQFEAVHKLGIDFAQGWLFGRPVSAKQIQEFIDIEKLKNKE